MIRAAHSLRTLNGLGSGLTLITNVCEVGVRNSLANVMFVAVITATDCSNDGSSPITLAAGVSGGAAAPSTGSPLPVATASAAGMAGVGTLAGSPQAGSPGAAATAGKDAAGGAGMLTSVAGTAADAPAGGGNGAGASGAGTMMTGVAGMTGSLPSMGDAAGAAGSADAAKPDCSPSEWKDPRTVPNPKLMAVAADAGKTGQVFGKSKGLEQQGYLEDEFFFTGTSPVYTSRLVVHRPKDSAKFSGTVYMEWYNVTGGVDMGVFWALNREYFIREGHVHVGVSAQQAGANALKDYDAQRYAPINHPGDTAANAIYSQAGMAIRSQSELLLGPCMPVRTVLAGGQSQSSARLASYLDAVPPAERLYDGYLLHSGGIPMGNPDVPVVMVFTMTEGDGKLVDRPNIVEWEVAGASHSDAYISALGQEEQGAAVGIMTKCAGRMNEYPSFMVYNAALDWLNRWARKGESPPKSEPLQVGKTDQYGNALGGVRIQDIEVPIATYSTEPAAAADPLDLLSAFVCGAGGSTVPLTKQQLLMLYPTHDDYVQKYTAAADKALAAGYLLRGDYDVAIAKAKAAPIPQ